MVGQLRLKPLTGNKKMGLSIKGSPYFKRKKTMCLTTFGRINVQTNYLTIITLIPVSASSTARLRADRGVSMPFTSSTTTAPCVSL